MPGIRGLFIPGPTNVPDRVRRAMDIPMEDQRAPDLPQLTVPLLEDVKKVFKSRTGQAFLFPSSGTGGWEAALTNTLSPGDKVLAARFGQFSHLWIDMCVRLGLDVDVVEAPWGEGVPVDIFSQRLKADRQHKIKAVLVTHNETATGVTSDVAGVRKVLDDAEHPALLFADGVSSIASIDFRMEDWRVDVAVAGSQKGFMLPAGLAILCVSPKALSMSENGKSRRCYFDFTDMARANKEGFFPYTPPTHLFRALRASLDLLFEEGLDHVFARHHRLAEGVRKAVQAWGLKLCAAEPRWQSDTVSAIFLPEGFDSNAFVRHAYKTYGLSLGVGLSKVAGRVFRVGHLGDLNELMVLSCLSGVELTLRDQGVPFTAGSGVAAAIEHFHRTRPAQLAKAA
jgi:alanine-glyoxylate transaminase / serine-glyoxylate transaminase / serine-pyruvate transaminase